MTRPTRNTVRASHSKGKASSSTAYLRDAAFPLVLQLVSSKGAVIFSIQFFCLLEGGGGLSCEGLFIQ